MSPTLSHKIYIISFLISFPEIPDSTSDSRASLMKLLKKVKSSLKKYENVNQKALDHLDSEEELESLQNRLDGLLKVLTIFCVLLSLKKFSNHTPNYMF